MIDTHIRKFAQVILLAAVLVAVAAAQNVTGTVRNGTNGKPAAGVDVTILDLSQGMTEAGSTKADSQGRYSLPLGGGQMPHLVRVTYQGANYFKMVPPGVTSADIQIFDSAKKVDGIAGTVRVIRAQTDANTLQVIELYAVSNKSSPPRTVASDNTFEIVLPDGAQIGEATAQGPNGQPISNPPSATKQKNHYAFSFPLRPGETRFQLSYNLPYSGQASLNPQNTIPFEHFVTMLPQTMKFEPKSPAQFSPMTDQPGALVQVATNVKPGQDLSFRVSGTGQMAADDQQQASAPRQSGGAVAGDSASATVQRVGPGGGLGPPIDAPDPLSEYRWWILGGLAIVMTGGAYLATTRGSRQAPAFAAASSAGIMTEPLPAPAAPTSRAVSAPLASPQPSTSTALLDAMKDELFQLEIERQQGQISQAEYEQHKAALDQTLKRALSRANKS
jgi:5-hydroxyisourate hydrolase-like protein (transthyretin family)